MIQFVMKYRPHFIQFLKKPLPKTVYYIKHKLTTNLTQTPAKNDKK